MFGVDKNACKWWKSVSQNCTAERPKDSRLHSPLLREINGGANQNRQWRKSHDFRSSECSVALDGSAIGWSIEFLEQTECMLMMMLWNLAPRNAKQYNRVCFRLTLGYSGYTNLRLDFAAKCSGSGS